MDILSQLHLIGKIVIAGLLAGVVGLEREVAEKPAGLRTHMLVGATATFLVTLDLRAIESLKWLNLIRPDPTQIITAIVIGVSFLGAGTIFRRPSDTEEPVHGLTTGASVLSVAAIGIAVAFDAYVLAVGVTLWDLLVNWGLVYLEDRMKRKLNQK